MKQIFAAYFSIRNRSNVHGYVNVQHTTEKLSIWTFTVNWSKQRCTAIVLDCVCFEANGVCLCVRAPERNGWRWTLVCVCAVCRVSVGMCWRARSLSTTSIHTGHTVCWQRVSVSVTAAAHTRVPIPACSSVRRRRHNWRFVVQVYSVWLCVYVRLTFNSSTCVCVLATNCPRLLSAVITFMWNCFRTDLAL